MKRSTQKISQILQLSLINLSKIKINKNIIEKLPDGQRDYQAIINNIIIFTKKTQQIISSINTHNYNIKILETIYIYIQNNIQKELISEDPDQNHYIITLLKNDYKLKSLLPFLDTCILMPDNIVTLWQNHPNYLNLQQHISYIKTQNKDQLIEKIKDMGKMMMTVNAVIINQNQYSQFRKKISFGGSFVYHKLNNKTSLIKVYNYFRNPDINIAKKIWNLPETGFIAYSMKIMFPSIKYNQKIYIPRKKIPKNQQVDIFTEDPNKICVRILNHQNLIKNSQPSGCCSSFIRSRTIYKSPITKIILHMHGGGFVALSSRTTQSYTRKWANQLIIPIFSIDYRLLPEHPYPAGLQDCFSVYEFLLDHIHNYFNMKIQKIILTGDSAGSNLCLALTALIMKNGMPLPYSMFLAYPPTDMRKRFSPSKIYSLDDNLLVASLLLMCSESYIGKADQNDPLINPLLLSQKYVNKESNSLQWPQKWPKTILLVGTKDPFYDDCIKILERMMISKIDCRLIILQQFIHGCLSLEFSISQCKIAIDQSIKYLKQLIN